MTKKLAVVFGIVFVIVGLLGFIQNPIVGAGAFFHTDAMHNAFHLLVGIVLLIAGANGIKASALWLKIFGIVYLVLFLDGLVQPELLGFIEANNADAWLHLVLGVVLLVAGYSSRSDRLISQTM